VLLPCSHGLPVEYEIDQKLGIRTKEDVMKIGVAAYNNECRSIVQRYTKEWEATVKRMGRWIDFKVRAANDRQPAAEAAQLRNRLQLVFPLADLLCSRVRSFFVCVYRTTTRRWIRRSWNPCGGCSLSCTPRV
jgi:isoleucyl-tRNA synthetase